MSETPPDPCVPLVQDSGLPGSTPQAEADRAARVAREAAALRANLARRKRQQRDQVPDPGASRGESL